MPQFNGKQGASFHRTPPGVVHRVRANLRCPRNGKRMGAARRPAPSSQATGDARQRRAPGRRWSRPASPDTGQHGGCVRAAVSPIRRRGSRPGQLSIDPFHAFFEVAFPRRAVRARHPRSHRLCAARAARGGRVRQPRRAARAGRAPATTVLTRRDIEAAQTPDLPTLLQRVAGLEITQLGGPGTVATASLRGAESRHTLVLVDGVPLNNLNFGLAAFEHLAARVIERIEVRARQRVQPVRQRRARRRDPGLHAAAHGHAHRQRHAAGRLARPGAGRGHRGRAARVGHRPARQRRGPARPRLRCDRPHGSCRTPTPIATATAAAPRRWASRTTSRTATRSACACARRAAPPSTTASSARPRRRMNRASSNRARCSMAGSGCPAAWPSPRR